MSIYQRYLSKSLIVFSSLLFLIIFLLESNFGFKLFFNTTNHFLWGLKFEEISGNWRDFKLKNITFNFFGISMKASNIRVLVNPISLFKVHKIFKKIETKNLILSFNKTNLITLKKEDFKKNILKNNIFLNKNVIFKEIYSDKILIKSRILNVFLSNFHSGLKFINNNFTIFNTNINFIQFNIKKNNKKYLLNNKHFLSQKDINNYLLHFLNNKMLLLPININLISIKCKKIKFFHQQLKNILFQGRLNNQFIFKLKCNDFIKFNLFVKVLLNSLNHPIYINFHVNRFTFPIKKKIIFSSRHLNMVLKGTINNYHLSFKDVICITGMPKIILNILGNGNLTNISFNKIYLIPFFNNFKKNELINLKKENYNQYISKLEGNINILNNFNKGINSINIPNFHIRTNIIDHNVSILGSLYYDNMNNVTIPKIIFLSGKNKGLITGKISKKININSSINANHLDYFIPNLKGTIIATLNIYGFYSSPNIYSILTGEKLNWKNILYLNNIKMLININSQTNLTKSIFIFIKKIKLFKLHLDFLKLNFFWNHTNQKFSLILKNKYLIMNSIIHGKFNYQKKIWEGNFKKINIFTFNKIWILNKNKNIFSNNTNVKINKKNTIKYQFSILSLIYKIKKIFPYILNSSINFETNLFFKTKFISKKNKKNCKIKIFLYSNNIKIKKNIKDIIFTKKISSFKLCIYFERNNIITQWSMHVLKNKTDKLFGYLNIYDYFKKANIQGKYFLFNFPCSILNFFISNTTRLKGFANGNIKILGAIYYPYISANIHLKKFYIESNKILKHIVLFFYPSFNLIKYIKINQTIFIKEGDILFKLNSNLKNNILNPIVWSVIFDSKKVIFFVLPKIQLNLSSKLNLRYFISKYDLIGYLKSCLFYFEFNEKNFIF